MTEHGSSACFWAPRMEASRVSEIKTSSNWDLVGLLFSNEPAEKRREAKGKREKERYTHLNAEFQRIARRDKKAFLSDQCKN